MIDSLFTEIMPNETEYSIYNQNVGCLTDNMKDKTISLPLFYFLIKLDMTFIPQKLCFITHALKVVRPEKTMGVNDTKIPVVLVNSTDKKRKNNENLYIMYE